MRRAAVWLGEVYLPRKSDVLECRRVTNSGTRPAAIALGRAVRGEDGLVSVNYGGRRVLLIPQGAGEMHKRLLVCPPLREAGYEGVDATAGPTAG